MAWFQDFKAGISIVRVTSSGCTSTSVINKNAKTPITAIAHPIKTSVGSFMYIPLSTIL